MSEQRRGGGAALAWATQRPQFGGGRRQWVRGPAALLGAAGQCLPLFPALKIGLRDRAPAAGQWQMCSRALGIRQSCSPSPLCAAIHFLSRMRRANRDEFPYYEAKRLKESRKIPQRCARPVFARL